MSRSKGKSLWGFGVAAIYGGFVLFILGLVVYASIQDRQLVEESYYEKGLAYQEKIDRIKRSINRLEIEHRYDNQEIVLQLLSPDSAKELSGDVELIRPSDARLDRLFMLDLDSLGQQVISTKGLLSGLWRIEINWTMDTLDYYNESRIVIP